MSWLARLKRKVVHRLAPEGSADDRSAPQQKGGAPRGESTAALLEEGWARNQAGDLAGADEMFSKVIDRGPDESAYYGRGVVRCKLGRCPAAITDLDLAIQLRPRFPAALAERGIAYVEGGQVDRGIEDYDGALAIDPSYGIAHGNKAAACLMLERWTPAINHLDVAIRLDPSQPMARYHRGIAHEMLGDLSRAARDYQSAIQRGPTDAFGQLAASRLKDLKNGADEVPVAEESIAERLWTQLIVLSLDDTVRDLLERVRHSKGAFFGVLTLPEGGRILVPIYGVDGIGRHLTDIADVLGPPLLDLKLRQFDALFHEPWSIPSSPEKDWRGLTELGRGLSVLLEGREILGVAMEDFAYHDPGLPTALFGERPLFARSELAGTAWRCASCGRNLAYFDAVIEGGKLTGYACPRCTTSPTEVWIEERMKPGRWSRLGFLGETEALGEVMTRDAETLRRLGLGFSQISEALDRLLAESMVASRERIEEATVQFGEELQASGRRGVSGLAILPLGLSLDDLEERVKCDSPIPQGRGTVLGDHEVFLELYLGYQHCPFTRLRLPWSNEVPAMRVSKRLVRGSILLLPSTDPHLTCRPDLSYRYSNLEFLVVNRKTGETLRGSGLLVHLIRDHHFFEGEQSPYRLDPERAARVLGLWAPP